MLTSRSVNEQPLAGRRAQAARRREQLLEAALGVFARRGVDGASVKAVAEAAGVAPGLIYHYFGSKEALVVAIIERYGVLPEVRRLLAETGDRPAAGVLTELAERLAGLLAERAPLSAMFLAGYGNPRVRKGLEAMVAEGQGLLAGFLASRVAAGELREHDSRAAAHMLISAIVLGQVAGIPLSPGALVDQLLHGLAAPGAAPEAVG